LTSKTKKNGSGKINEGDCIYLIKIIMNRTHIV